MKFDDLVLSTRIRFHVHNKDSMWMCHYVWKDNDDLKMDITAV